MKTALVLPPVMDLESAMGQLWDIVSGCVNSTDEISLWLPCDKASIAAPLPIPDRVGTVFCGSSGLSREWAPESALTWLQTLYAHWRPDLLAFHGSIAGHELSVRLSARLKCPCLTEVRELRAENGALYAEKKAFSAHLSWRVALDKFPFVVSVRGAGSSSVPLISRPLSAFQTMPLPLENEGGSRILGRRKIEAAVKNPLETAPLVLVGGSGLGDSLGRRKLADCAERLGAVVGFTRPVALSDQGSLSKLLGQSGLRIAPDVCMVLGASGSTAFIVGIESAKLIIAVNTDKDAPIFKYADIGVIADAGEFIDAILSAAEEGPLS